MTHWLRLLDHESFSAIDREFGQFCARISTSQHAALLGLLAGLTSQARASGDSCLDLSALAGSELPKEWRAPTQSPLPATFPERPHMQEVLQESQLVGSGTPPSPLVLAGGKLYLYRYWDAERTLCERIHHAAASTIPPWNDTFRDTFQRLFGPFGAEPDWQAAAAFAACRSNFCLITGGPGTGKTTTVVRLLALLLQQQPDTEIAVAAPTGKAVARLNESLTGQIARLPEDLSTSIPREAQTLHRLLAYNPTMDRFGYGVSRPLPYQVVVVDEASMVDILLMASLVKAMPPNAKLILLGDHQQLASVDAGNVLADLCHHAGLDRKHSTDFCEGYQQISGQHLDRSDERGPTFRDAVVVLQKSHRFDDRTGIGGLSAAIRQGQADRAMAILENQASDDVRLEPPPAHDHQLLLFLEPHLKRYYHAPDLKTAFQVLGELQLLTGLREGRWGVAGLNQLIENLLRRRALTFHGDHYDRRPIMVTRNDYTQNLYNGDIGICWMTDTGLQAAFPVEGGTFRMLPLIKLPQCESAWALTVHKSQGSEFDKILFLLPPKDHPLCTRELLYTGLTRARQSATLFGTEDQTLHAIARTIHRVSGLADRLKDDGQSFDHGNSQPENSEN